MIRKHSRLYFDNDDYRLLDIVNQLLDHGENSPMLRKLYDSYLHSRGIKELAATKSLRIASAMIDLLGTLEKGTAKDRLIALRSVRAEALHGGNGKLPNNLARVLLQIMKEILRNRENEHKQLALAHDFRCASSGKPRLIRQQLRRFNLLEMPEEWNQLAFDHHVHDAATKGRKSPTHLIMDAWIKGIRFLGVVYYNFVQPEVAAELLEAAEIMGIEVRIGIEVCARHYDKYVHLVWSPRGFLGRKDFLAFLGEDKVVEFMNKGREVAHYTEKKILGVMRLFNERWLADLNAKFSISIPHFQEKEFLAFVGHGQASMVHLAEYIHNGFYRELQQKFTKIAKQASTLSPEDLGKINESIDMANCLVPETIFERYLRPLEHELLLGEPLPELFQLDSEKMLDLIDRLPCRSRITLNPTNLTPEDVLETLFTGRGRISHLEVFNLKDWSQGLTEHRSRIDLIRIVINSGNIVQTKRLVRECLARIENSSKPNQVRIERFNDLLRNIPQLLDYYRHNRLQSRLGSDSIGKSRYSPGMGLVVIPTLPLRARMIIGANPQRKVPVVTTALRHKTAISGGKDQRQRYEMYQRFHNYSDTSFSPHKVSWTIGENTTTLAEHGNIGTLGGLPEEKGNGFRIALNGNRQSRNSGGRISQLNTALFNLTKILIGFIPAYFTFYLTKDWWFIAYFGAVIWFMITGLRNILQSVVGGGGLIRSPLLSWNDFISWNRISDSLLFTGFSVPLLDCLVKDITLARTFDVTTTTNPFLLYSAIAVINGIYISAHNLYRGLPPAAVIGNFFRTILSIPVALGLNELLFIILIKSGYSIDAIQEGLQLWAAVVSKTASDFVAAIIEGSADRRYNLDQRNADYREKINQIYDTHARLEVTYPEGDALSMYENTKEMVEDLSVKSHEILRTMVINGLDMLYFWMYQPRAQIAFRRMIAHMPVEERVLLYSSQKILTRKRLVSKMLLNGLVGRRFEKVLAFYLSRTDQYLDAIAVICKENTAEPKDISFQSPSNNDR